MTPYRCLSGCHVMLITTTGRDLSTAVGVCTIIPGIQHIVTRSEDVDHWTGMRYEFTPSMALVVCISEIIQGEDQFQRHGIGANPIWRCWEPHIKNAGATRVVEVELRSLPIGALHAL